MHDRRLAPGFSDSCDPGSARPWSFVARDIPETEKRCLEVQALIGAIRQFTPNWQRLYGGRENSKTLFQVLALAFPTAEAFVDLDGHILTKIDSRFYDIYGIQAVPDEIYSV